jgi:general secretion pathway protein D
MPFRANRVPSRAGLLAAIGIPAALLLLSTPARADEPAFRTLSVKPQYLPPGELCRLLGLEAGSGGERLRIGGGEGPARWVEVRRNDASNLLLLTGAPADVAAAAELVTLADVAPRQVEIEVRLLEVNQAKARDLGIDWNAVVQQAGPRASWQYNDGGGYPGGTRRGFTATSQLNLPSVLTFLDESGAATIRNAPRLLTVNNRRATILDGQRVTYVARYSSYTNLFQTDSLDTGVRLSVVPSLGESGYLTMDVEAELTRLADQSYISGSPVKDGQIVKNTVVCRSGETVLLGGLTRTQVQVTHRRFPILGRILPFIFSREVRHEQVMESYVLLTPRVVDLQAAVDPAAIEQRIDNPGDLTAPTPIAPFAPPASTPEPAPSPAPPRAPAR